ncbi:hypothetical protein RF11_07724 [Thelohanellus kitauei]|uniref:Uncharacterized protein n=1 Tax=Thelohanellus kitauei TaxID=669202 RepID=A0A0C2MJH3_THEKT|nr:hypothetical protein RF11_07724 [Thelohanellus kitauei]
MNDPQLIIQTEALSLFKLFLKCIKIGDPILSFNPHCVIDTIVQCHCYGPFHVLIINENTMFHLFYFFKSTELNLAKIFKKMGHQIHNVDLSIRDHLNSAKITENVEQIMNRLSATEEEDIAWLLFIILRMLCRVALIGRIEFNVTQLYSITNSTFLSEIKRKVDSKHLKRVSKTWSGILNESRNTIQIDSISKLVFISAIYAMDLSRKLKTVFHDLLNYEMSSKKLQRIYIIYFTLVAFPLIDDPTYPLLHEILIELHGLIQKYIENPLFNRLVFKKQFLIIQYYTMSLSVLNIHVSHQDEQMIEGFSSMLSQNKWLKLHSSYITSNFLLNIFDNLQNRGSIIDTFIFKIKNLLQDLIEALTNDDYINKLISEQKLFMYEDVKTDYLMIIKQSFIKICFLRCELSLRLTSDNQGPEIFENNSYNRCKEVLTKTISSFNESNYLDKNSASLFMRWCGIISSDCSNSHSYLDDIDSLSDAMRVASISEQPNTRCGIHIQAILRWFTLIYEMKFIFMDINSKTDGLLLC